MDFLALSFYFYLLFPRLYASMDETDARALYHNYEPSYVIEANKTKLSDYQLEVKKLQLMKFLGYDVKDIPEDYKEYNLDSPELFYEIDDENDYPLPDGLENPMAGPQSPGSELYEGNTTDKITVSEMQYFNSDEKLRLFTYGEEEFTLGKTLCGQKEIVNVNGDLFERLLYSDDNKLIEKIIWKNAQTLEESKMLKKFTYTYKNSSDAVKPYLIIFEDYTNSKKIKTTYDDKGNAIYSEYFDSVKLEDESIKEYLTKTVSHKYNADNKLLEEDEKSFYFLQDYSSSQMQERKTKYFYTQKSSLPDSEFYENNVLRIKVTYADQDRYEKRVYFDDNFSVLTRYKDGRKKVEIFYNSQTEIKRRRYE